MPDNRIIIEQLKNLIQSLGYAVDGYNIGADRLTATIKIGAKDLNQDQQNLIGIQLRRIVATQAWTITASQKIGDDLVFSLEKEI